MVEKDRSADATLIGKQAIIPRSFLILGKIISLQSEIHLMASQSIHSPKNTREKNIVCT